MKHTKGYYELRNAGYSAIEELTTKGALFGPTTRGKWYRAGTVERVLILRQSARIWHAFFTHTGTASGSTANSCTCGGLGDAISTDSELRAYERLVTRAPNSWADDFHGLSAAKSQCYNS